MDFDQGKDGGGGGGGSRKGEELRVGSGKLQKFTITCSSILTIQVNKYPKNMNAAIQILDMETND